MAHSAGGDCSIQRRIWERCIDGITGPEVSQWQGASLQEWCLKGRDETEFGKQKTNAGEIK